MKATQIRAEEIQSARRDATESRPAGANQQTLVNIEEVLRQIIREELAAGDEE